jgi:hypothetical protein
MKNIKIILVAIIMLSGCRKEDSTPTQMTESSNQSYYHLSTGDLFIYHKTYFPQTEVKDTFKVSQSVTVKETTYYTMKNFPLGETTIGKDVLLRSDSNGDIYTLYIANGDTLTDLLYKCSGKVGDKWTTKTLGPDITFEIFSKSDTTSTTLGNYSQCIKFLIHYGYYAREWQWLAPNVGLVKNDHEDFTGRPGPVKYSLDIAKIVFQ